ncbi:short-chain dehydrogenase [Croceicoccus estronivorus]|uniref:SDR family NAD(P)-dependent oxidoreductase n=1 Tax=Croceicoccus estronivorus TaxID=1172626 RepID=UPI00083661D0|nr:SDR family oxidoreductase [Croceicoccus estronivorus]OCC23334.1 short-chain dehydrogenase [Croceicoccus estronivorus]
MLDLAGKLYVVAGAGGGGIGTETCAMLASAGAHVLALDKTTTGCTSALAALGGDTERHGVIQADLEHEAELAGILAREQQRFGPVRGLVNIVGGIPARELVAPLLDADALATFEQLMHLNLIPALAASRAVAELMTAHRQGGSIVNTASASGHVSMAFAGGYGAAKAALMNLTRTMAVEWGRCGIRANAVSPGTIRTAKIGRDTLSTGQADSGEEGMGVIPLNRRGLPRDVSGVILFLLSDLAAYVSGQVIGVDGGMMARPPYNDASELPVFMVDPALRERLT